MAERLCEDLQVVVLMGGLGSRLGEKTKNLPKPMIKVAGKPFFLYQFELMLLAGFKRFVFCLGHCGDAISDFFGDGSRWGAEITYSYDGEKLLGTGGAVRKALPLLEEDFLLIYGDSFMDIDYFEVTVRYRQAVQRGQEALMTVMHNRDRFDKSNVICRNGDIVLYDKATHDPQMEYIDYGVSVFRRVLFEGMPEEEAFDLSRVQYVLSRRGTLACCEVEHRFYEIGTPDSLEEFQMYAARRWGAANKAVFLDRDGVINKICWNEDIEQLDSPLKREQFQMIPGAAEALKVLQDKGFLLFIVTNQPAAAKGTTTFAELCAIDHSFVQQMQQLGVDIADVAMCPHFGKASPLTKETYLIRECDCRKPGTGLINTIRKKYNIDMERSWMVGDSATDIICGKDAGLNTAFLGKFKCDLCMMTGNRKPDMVCMDLKEFSEELS